MEVQAKTEEKFKIIQQMLSRNNNLLNISWLCEYAGVSRSGYYNWLSSKDHRNKREEEDRKDFEIILAAYQFRGYDKGKRGIYMRLLNTGVRMNIKKISRLMKKFNLTCPIRKANPYRRMAKALKTNNVAENLLNREFTNYGARMVLLTDITYISYANSQRAYLSTILDAYTKQILAYVLSESLEIDFVLETVHILIREHGISLTSETLIHSDQGCHYTSVKFQEIISKQEIRQSMSRRGNCWDNAPQESFFGHMKDEIHLGKCNTFNLLKQETDNYIDYYNNNRYQWNLAKLSPNKYYEYLETGEYPIKI
ncbi:IS3 family transposase [Clostridium gasigenes]|uniref:IS3 family transposase n=6 Tax=Clostridium gasigenes TaxID=94869 RepID=A0A7X0SGB0_9CLOT|nr:IS3 family transposase [Clostridium gasigenes]MBB6715031.1 IS3 family transposase [Clostridium gasigenes]